MIDWARTTMLQDILAQQFLTNFWCRARPTSTCAGLPNSWATWHRVFRPGVWSPTISTPRSSVLGDRTHPEWWIRITAHRISRRDRLHLGLACFSPAAA